MKFLVERTFGDGLRIPPGSEGARLCAGDDRINELEGVRWLHSYVSDDLHKTWCIFEGPTTEAIRIAARANNLPIDTITPIGELVTEEP